MTDKRSKRFPSGIWPAMGWVVVLLAVYGPLIVHPSLHPAFPENDIWNRPVRWSVAQPLSRGVLPLWNPLTSFGMPWLAQFQTEVFYPGTLVFSFFGLGAWNLYSLFHLLLYAAGLYGFLRATGVGRFWAGAVSMVGLVTPCAFHHIGSNAPADTMAWIPWVFWGARRLQDRLPRAAWMLGTVTVLQVLAGYPQIVLVTWLGVAAYLGFLGGWKSLLRVWAPGGAALLVTCAQWLPGLEFFGLHAVRRPSMPDNPFHVLPLENLRTLWDLHALAGAGQPDYLRSPTFFYHNLYAGLLPLLAVVAGAVLIRKVSRETRADLFLLGMTGLWSFGFFVRIFDRLHLPYPEVLEASKMWVVLVFFLLVSAGRVLDDLLPKPGRWAWVLLALAVLDPSRAVFDHPLDKGTKPMDPAFREETRRVTRLLNGGRLLPLADGGEYRRLALAGGIDRTRPVFKHFIPNSNMLFGIPVANGNGSTWPSQGSLNALLYFQYGFPYEKGALLDLLAVDLIHLPESRMSDRFRKVDEWEGWGLYENPRSVGERFFITGRPQRASRKEAFDAFAEGRADPRKDLFLDPEPASNAPLRRGPPRLRSKEYWVPDTASEGWLIVTENALPGWRAWVDGTPAVIDLADGIFQAVPYPPGANAVVLSYEPSSFRLGLFVSLASLAFCLALLLGSPLRPVRIPSRRRSNRK